MGRSYTVLTRNQVASGKMSLNRKVVSDGRSYTVLIVIRWPAVKCL